jgi:hypothetical protein
MFTFIRSIAAKTEVLLLFTKSTVHNFSLKEEVDDDNNCSASQKITQLLWKLKVHYRAWKSPPLDPTHSELNTVNTFTSPFFKILLTSSVSICFHLLRGIFPSSFQTKVLYSSLIPSMHGI